MNDRPTAAPSINKLIVFGDSLSDMGNAGRASNAEVWVEHLARMLSIRMEPSSLGGTNYAVGGALLDPTSGSTSLPAQVKLFERTDRESEGALFIVYGGANDILGAIGRPDASKLMELALRSLGAILLDLIRLGAHTFLIPNLPDVGIAPAVRQYGPPALQHATSISKSFNTGQEQVLLEIEPRLPASGRVYRLDVYAMGERVRSDPSAFGFADIDSPCQGCPSCEGHLFWDSIHPTSQAHQQLAAAAHQLLRT